MKTFTLLILLLTHSISYQHAASFKIKEYSFHITNSWDAKLVKVQSYSQIIYETLDKVIKVEVKKNDALISDKKKGYAHIVFKPLKMKIRNSKKDNQSLKRIKHTLIFTFEKQEKQYQIKIDYPFYSRNLERPELFAKLPTHHRILSRRLNGLAFDLTDQEQKTQKIYNEKRRDWLDCSEYLINDSDSLFSQNFSSRYEFNDDTK